MRPKVLLLILLSCSPLVSQGETIHREKSLYQNIVVRQTSDRRCLVFAKKRGDRNQTCMDLRNPERLVFPYVRMTFGGLLVEPNPEHILVVGLGGGSIPVTLNQMFPEAHIDIVEIDEAVVRVAREFFRFQETPSMRVYVSDARVFVKRARLRDKRYDFIILDAFTGDYIPEHLMTLEFLNEIKDILNPGGVLVANTFSTSALYDHESVTYQQAFGDFLNFKMPVTNNRVIIASNDELPEPSVIRERAAAFSSRLEPYGVDIEDYPRYLSRDKDWDESKRPLTDQYSPVNLLRGKVR